MSEYRLPVLKNESQLNGYSKIRASVDYSKTKVIGKYTHSITGVTTRKIQFCDKNGKELLIWDHEEAPLGHVVEGRSGGLSGLYPKSDIYYYNNVMIEDFDGDKTIDKIYNAQTKKSQILNEPNHPVCDFIARYI